jgi:hypothetical protein
MEASPDVDTARISLALKSSPHPCDEKIPLMNLIDEFLSRDICNQDNLDSHRVYVSRLNAVLSRIVPVLVGELQERMFLLIK